MILFNGANGGLGRYFAEAAANSGIPALAIRSRLEDLEGQKAEFEAVRAPSLTFIQFAAKVSVPWCEAHPEETRKTNVDDTCASARAFFEYAARRGVPARLIYVSSAHLYARNDGVIHETDPVLPRSVYARTKLEAENGLRFLAEQSKADLRIARVFGLVAPGQPENYILPAMLKRAREKRLEGVPGVSNTRDYLDARDVCRALLAIAKLDSDDYARACPDRILNVASGRGQTIRSLLEGSLSALYPENEAKALAAKITEAPPRADDVPSIVASIDRYRALFGEFPARIPIADTIRDSLKPPTAV